MLSHQERSFLLLLDENKYRKSLFSKSVKCIIVCSYCFVFTKFVIEIHMGMTPTFDISLLLSFYFLPPHKEHKNYWLSPI